MKYDLDRKNVTLLLIAILALGLLLRVFNAGHVLQWDEAWNVQTIIEGARGVHNAPFFLNFWRHPPLYTGLGIAFEWIFHAGRIGVSYAMEGLSILCALASMVVIFLCGRDWFDERAGLVGAFLFAVMPVARIFDTWIKQESATALLGLLFLLFFFRKRYVLAGVFLGLAILTKETAIFFPLALGVFIILNHRPGRFRGFVQSVLVAALAAFWWFVFFSISVGSFSDFFIGRGAEAAQWHRPWYYYIKRLPGDLGWPMLVILAASIVILAVHLWISRGRPRGEEYTPSDMALFTIIWALVVYLFLSVSYGKPPWMIYSALPAFALFGGWGAIELASVFAEQWKTVTRAVVGLALVACLALSIPVSFGDYAKNGDFNYEGWKAEKRTAEYINSQVGSRGRIIVNYDELSPVLLFYLDLYDPARIAVIPRGAPENLSVGNLTVLALDSDTSFEQAVARVMAIRPDFVVLRYRETANSLAVKFKTLARPREFMMWTVFRGPSR